MGGGMKTDRMKAILGLFILIILSLACGLPGPGFKEKNIQNAYLTSDVNSKKAASVFPADAPIICVIELVDISSDATVTTTWKAVKADGLEKGRVIYQQSSSPGSGTLVRELIVPRPLAVGTYQVDIYFEDVAVRTLDFTVEEGAAPLGFEKADCTVGGWPFTDISVGNVVTDVFDGPSLICNVSGTGEHGGSEVAYISILTLKKDKLEELYLEKQQFIKGDVDRAIEWNALPDLPASSRNEITFIRDDEDGYIYMITFEANVDKCLDGRGYGVEKINDRYLVEIQFMSCELGNAGAYTTALITLQQTALRAIQRVEEANANQK